ncbi:MAG: DNA polymerase III subunit gamma/tau [Deltaproteobacteria bacterium]|nr:DNA polymerase III subunit gamma/tau [Deltaproteobacteria bacterium]
MSYLVLARKWRPQVFEDVIGQRHVSQTLQNAITSKRVAHAYLFSGPRGVGKTTVARIFAKALNCLNGPAPVPCNECQICRDITRSSSVDVLEIDGASNTGVDSIRELRETVKYLPSMGRYRIYIIDEVHMLSNNAFNALLKTLEEPPAHTIFMFATTEPHKIPNTILSRCQRFDFKRIPLKDVQTQLRHIAASEGIDISDTAIFLLANESEGSMRDSQSLLDQVISFSGSKISDEDVMNALGIMDRKLLFQFADSIIKRDDETVLNLIENIYNFGYDLKRFCQSLLEYFRNLVVIKTVKDGKDVLDVPDIEILELQKLAKDTSFLNLQMLFNILYRGFEDVSRSALPRFIFEMTALRMTHIDSSESLTDIIKKLDTLSSGSTGKEEQKVKGNNNLADVVSDMPYSSSNKEISVFGFKSSGSSSDLWKKLVAFIKKKKPALASHLEFAVPDVINEKDISVRVKDGHYYTYLVNNKDNFSKLCEEFFGKQMVIEIRAGKDENETVSAKNETMEDPIIKDALKIFGGRIV